MDHIVFWVDIFLRNEGIIFSLIRLVNFSDFFENKSVLENYFKVPKCHNQADQSKGKNVVLQPPFSLSLSAKPKSRFTVVSLLKA